MDGMDAAVAELTEGLSEGAEQPTGTPTEAAPDVEMYEIPYGDQTYKIPLNHELPIKHGGQIIKAPLEKVLNAYRERQHLSDKFSAFNREREEFDEKMKGFGDLNQLAELQKIQKWSTESPEEFERFWEMYQNRNEFLKGAGEGNDGAAQQEVIALRTTVNDLNEKLATLMEAHEQTQTDKDVDEVNQEIDTFKSQYGERYGINLDETNEDGLTLRAQIIQHGIENNLDSFKLAAFSLLEDRLFATATQEGSKKVAEKIRADKKAGIIGRSATPQAGETEIDPWTMTDDQAFDAAVADFHKMVGQ